MYARRLQVSAAEWRAKMRDEGRRVQAIWIFGPAGTGNSSLAKQYAQSKGEPFFVSGSTRDVFQGYAGQHTIILDELRPSSIPYADLLRVTDPYAIEHEVMAPARYADKAIAADLIIVTTPYNPMEFYCEQVRGATVGRPNDDIDGFGQLERRLSLVVEMQQKEICLSEFRVELGTYWPADGSSRPNPYSSFVRGSSGSGDSAHLYEALLDSGTVTAD